MSVVLLAGIMGCAASSAGGLFYTCTDGSFNIDKFDANACFSFLTSNCTPTCPPPPTPDPVPVLCRYVDVKQTTSNTFVLSDINVVGGDTGITSLIRNMTPATSIDGIGTSSLLIDDAVDTDAPATSSFTLDLGDVRKVLSVTLTNTTDATHQADVCGVKVTLRRPLYQGEASTSTGVNLDESPIIEYVANTYSYTVGSTTWK